MCTLFYFKTVNYIIKFSSLVYNKFLSSWIYGCSRRFVFITVIYEQSKGTLKKNILTN